MLWVIGIIIAYLGAFWVMTAVLRVGGREGVFMVLATMGFPSAIYATIAYFLASETMPASYFEMSVFMVSLASLGVNIGRVLANPLLIKEVKKDKSANAIPIVINANIETGAIFSLLAFILGYVAFENDIWKNPVTSPEGYLTGMVIMGIFSAIGGIAYGITVRATLQRFEEHGISLKPDGFRKLMINGAFPATIYVLGLLFALLVFMGAL